VQIRQNQSQSSGWGSGLAANTQGNRTTRQMQSEQAGSKDSRSNKQSRSYTGNHTRNKRSEMYAWQDKTSQWWGWENSLNRESEWETPVRQISHRYGDYGICSPRELVLRRCWPLVVSGGRHRGCIRDRAPPLWAAPDARRQTTPGSSSRSWGRFVRVISVEITSEWRV